MENVWTLANIDEVDFVATATVLAMKVKGMSIAGSEQSEVEYNSESESGCETEDDWATSRPSSLSGGYPRLMDKFLDRLAEVFACEKYSVRQRSGQGAKHVSATAWIEPDETSSLIILVAKNEGIDDRDRKMMSLLQRWFRSVAITRRHPSILTDILWHGDAKHSGLVEYNRNRLCCHISQINMFKLVMSELGDHSTRHGRQIKELQSLCQVAMPEPTTEQLIHIIEVAYELRQSRRDHRAVVKHTKALQSIYMLGRIRAAYECLKSTALNFPAFSKMQIQPVDLCQPAELDVVMYEKRLYSLVEQFKQSRWNRKKKAARSHMGASRLHKHAEMQILVTVLGNIDWHKRVHHYIGISKKPCFLCFEMLQNYIEISISGPRIPIFKTRRSHGKVYWLWTLPQIDTTSVTARLALPTALSQTYKQIYQLLQHGPVLQPAIAESSAGVTVVTTISDGHSALKERYLAKPRISSVSASIEDTPVVFGKETKSVQVGLIPANGMEPRLTLINFHAPSGIEDPRVGELASDLVPDFHESWSGHQLDRQYRQYIFKKQAFKDLNGSYRLYWNENPDLPENESIKTMLSITKVDVFRQFWYGDVFIVRYTEHPTTFAYDVHDLSADVLAHLMTPLSTSLRDMWRDEYLEDQLERDRYHATRQEKLEADKEVIFQRM